MTSAGTLDFGLTKTCENDLLCTVSTSTFDRIPSGTKMTPIP